MAEAAYLKLHETGELARRAEQAVASLAECRVCPRDCGVDRLANESAVCHTGRHVRVASYFAHRGEEYPLRGWKGSGTIFFSLCNLRCVFCQNWDISQVPAGEEATPERLATICMELQELGCHNINFVTPEHVVPQILEALPIGVERGLRLPLVYNTSAYDSMESLELLDGVIDIYMPDFKFWNAAASLKYLKAKDYPEVARRVIREMHRQVGPLQLDEDGIATRGLLVRHLVMPGNVAGTREICDFVARELGPETYLNLMNQYFPAGRVGANYGEIGRRLYGREEEQARAWARQAGLVRLDRDPIRGG